MTPQLDLSVTIIAGAEEHNIRACLDSVSWAPEIIVLCSSMEDRTLEIAREYTDKAEYRPFTGYADQKGEALHRATRTWVLSLDADERVPPELRDEILARLATDPTEDGFRIPRKSFYGTRWIRHGKWYPDYQLRLFRRERTTMIVRRVHEGFAVDGRIGHLQHPFLHYTMPQVRHMLEKNVRYSRYEAEDKAHRRRASWFSILFRPAGAFFSKYIADRSFLDGMEGLVIACVHALTKLQVELYLWEMQRSDQNTSS